MRADTRQTLIGSNVDLTPREREIAALVALGLTNREIAVTLSLKVATIKAHMASIFVKLRVHNRVGLTLAWMAQTEHPFKRKS